MCLNPFETDPVKADHRHCWEFDPYCIADLANGFHFRGCDAPHCDVASPQHHFVDGLIAAASNPTEKDREIHQNSLLESLATGALEFLANIPRAYVELREEERADKSC
jgi:hypothetical protein